MPHNFRIDSSDEVTSTKVAGTNSILLSVYLIILTFFIVLTSKASFEDVKIKAAQESIKHTFKTEPLLQSSVVQGTGSDTSSISSKLYLEELVETFRTSIQAVKIEKAVSGSFLRASFYSESMFLQDTAEIRPAQRGLLGRITAGLANPPDGFDYEMEFTIGAQKQDGEYPVIENLSLRRAGAFARDMIKRGVPPHKIFTGFHDGSPRRINITFRVVEE